MPEQKREEFKNPILLFDGVCNLCAQSVQFILRRDPRGYFKFAPLQSPAGQSLLQKFNLPTKQFESMILIQENRYYTKSTAAFQIAKHLKYPWPLLYVLILLPRFLRDALYGWVARNRYRWFGKKDACMIPTPELKDRFLV